MRLLFALVPLALLQACASSSTSCPLNNEDGYCASVEEVYSAAQTRAGNDENVMANGRAGGGVHGGPVANGETIAAAHPLFDPGPGLGLAGPIYMPAQPRRLWVAPWTDANGVMHSGEYLYFLKPGHWRYGPLRAPGAASGVLGPVAPSDLGFTPGAPDPDDPSNIVGPRRQMGSQSDQVFPVVNN